MRILISALGAISIISVMLNILFLTKPAKTVVEYRSAPEKTFSSKEARELYAEKTGMRLHKPYAPLYDHGDVTSPDGEFQASVIDLKNQHAISIREIKTQDRRDYVVDESWGIIQEVGDLHFSPDGKELAFAAYSYSVAADNDEVLASDSGMPSVYKLDLQSGKIADIRSAKDAGIILRVTSWTDEEPSIGEQDMTEDQNPGTAPALYLPYILNR